MIDYPKRFLGRTVVQCDMGPLNDLMKPAKIFSSASDWPRPSSKKRSKHGRRTRSKRADLLDPIVLGRFQELERLFGGEKRRAAFDDARLLLAVETGDRLDMGTMFAPLEGTGRVAAILKDFDLIFDLVDAPPRRVEGPIAGVFSAAHARDSGRR